MQQARLVILSIHLLQVRSYKMSATYTKETTIFGDELIVRTDDAGIIAFIPTDPANSDYQAYLASLEAPQG